MFSVSIPDIERLTWTFDDDRVSIVLDAYRGVVGVGDSPSRAEGEKLAALSALYQLVATGMVSLLQGNLRADLLKICQNLSDQSTQPRS
jgi:hypothetical protein